MQDKFLRTIAHNNDVLVGAVNEFTRLLQHQPDIVKPMIFYFTEQKACNIGRVAGIPDSKPVNTSSDIYLYSPFNR
ncbi:hypothetical protein F5B21DRAFT_452941 [Xylaria acuta]|nr:hypothetical protein F5B21DRAFT_452941 [Xylaria acuta]